MSDQDKRLTGSIDEYLLGLAEGVRRAQHELGRITPGLQRGEVPITYQIPRLDFELKLSLALGESGAGAGPSGQGLRFRPSAAASGSSSRALDISSVLRGSLVAVPGNGGKPLPVITTTLRRVGPRRLEFTVKVESAAGQRLAGIEVNLNVDPDLSRRFSPLPDTEHEPLRFDDPSTPLDGAALDRPFGLQPGTRFWDGLLITDTDGQATGVLDVDPMEPAGTCIVSVVEVLGQTETFLFSVEN